jgi:hypothetical protein
MIEYVKQLLMSQFEASLAMLRQCIAACPPEHWEGKIANGTFRSLRLSHAVLHRLHYCPANAGTIFSNPSVFNELH